MDIGERNKYDFQKFHLMIVKIREIVLFTRATPGSSLVLYISTVHIGYSDWATSWG